MRRNTTQLRNLRTGKPKNPGLKTNPGRKSAGVATNYSMMLQIYCLNKKEAAIKKELKHEKLILNRSIPTASKPSYSITAMIVSFLNESLLLLKKLRPGVTMITE